MCELERCLFPSVAQSYKVFNSVQKIAGHTIEYPP